MADPDPEPGVREPSRPAAPPEDRTVDDLAQPSRTPPPRTLTVPFEYSVATAFADGERSWLKEGERPDGVTARVVVLPESECA